MEKKKIEYFKILYIVILSAITASFVYGFFGKIVSDYNYKQLYRTTFSSLLSSAFDLSFVGMLFSLPALLFIAYPICLKLVHSHRTSFLSWIGTGSIASFVNAILLNGLFTDGKHRIKDVLFGFVLLMSIGLLSNIMAWFFINKRMSWFKYLVVIGAIYLEVVIYKILTSQNLS